MDFYFFKLLEIPVSFNPDLSLLRRNYYRLSRATHPDHIQSESDDEQLHFKLQSGDINAAYKTLTDNDLRIKYILENYGLLDKNNTIPIDQDFLMEMMDINEEIEELHISLDKNRLSSLKEMIKTKQTAIHDQLSIASRSFDIQEDKKSVLKEIKDIYLKSRYLLRIHESLSTFALS